MYPRTLSQISSCVSPEAWTYTGAALRHFPPCASKQLDDGGRQASAGEEGGRGADEQLDDGHPCELALDVIKSHVHTAQGVVQHRPRAPVGGDVSGLPDVLNLADKTAFEERVEEVIDRGDDGGGAPREGGAAEAV